MVDLAGVSYSYPGCGMALEKVEVCLGKGLTVLVGPNAGGKTTLLRILAGLLEVETGEIRLRETGKKMRAMELRRLSRMVMQDADPQLLGATVREDIELGRAASEFGEKFDEMVRRLSERFGLAELLDQTIETLSYGQKKKLCLVHALLAGPKMLLLDEPFAGLDYPAGKELREFIRRNGEEGLSQVISTHELEPVFDLAELVVVVAGGKVVRVGTPEDVAPELGKWSVRAPGQGW